MCNRIIEKGTLNVYNAIG